ncbi:universal stress protein [Microtetraspora sp. NBRC 16547]|uniref:universal stress protein n=1 Tax=Microtetraspora sp. NBRC 16547 TaxID=3030993 RepID=UPI0024A0E437|nr:universal stress protein [Microtetraspora sp. NBRC 16547]GLW99106.1 universal stress protein [Microtetraspora sp. NBRC 16547]
MAEPIVVGADGSPAASAAVAWAADDAAKKGAPLRVVHAVYRLPYASPPYPIPGLDDALTRAGGQFLLEAERLALGRHPDLDVSTRLFEGGPARVLIREAASASELVVGSRGRGGFTGMLLGSVSTQLAGHAAVPVVVVRPGHTEAARPEVVVGVDESQECEPALAYAFEQARLRGCLLRAVHGWRLPPEIYTGWFVYDLPEMQQLRESLTAGRLAAWRARYTDVSAEVEVICDHPVAALVEAAKNAAVLVVGSHGRGGVGAMVLGSVSRGVLHHARCPVAVVRSRPADRTSAQATP